MAVRTAVDLVPPSPTLDALRAAAADCTACDLYKCATQTVFGEGKPGARLLFVGEQPGDKEDLAGHPFVGPAGKILDDGLAAAGIDREAAYVTNVVKHFKWEARGKRRIHKKPSALEVAACRPWLDAEIAAVQPDVVVCLGATAAQALLGRSFRITKQRGQFFEGVIGPVVTATAHPSSILRAADEAARVREFAVFVEDLTRVAKHIRVT